MGIRENARRGKEGEEVVRGEYEFSLWETKKKPARLDITAVKRNVAGKVTKRRYVEVKTGKAHLSKAEKEAKKGIGGRYKVDRKNPWL